jgi:hypothetical protein
MRRMQTAEMSLLRGCRMTDHKCMEDIEEELRVADIRRVI